MPGIHKEKEIATAIRTKYYELLKDIESQAYTDVDKQLSQIKSLLLQKKKVYDFLQVGKENLRMYQSNFDSIRQLEEQVVEYNKYINQLILRIINIPYHE